jgi:hypothetical protein
VVTARTAATSAKCSLSAAPCSRRIAVQIFQFSSAAIKPVPKSTPLAGPAGPLRAGPRLNGIPGGSGSSGSPQGPSASSGSSWCQGMGCSGSPIGSRLSAAARVLRLTLFSLHAGFTTDITPAPASRRSTSPRVEADQGGDALPGELLVTLARNPTRTILRQPAGPRRTRRCHVQVEQSIPTLFSVGNVNLVRFSSKMTLIMRSVSPFGRRTPLSKSVEIMWEIWWPLIRLYW